MKRDTINYVLVGAAVIGGFALLFMTLVVITGSRGATVRYPVRFADVTGLQFGAPVLYQGFRIGQVQAIVPERGELTQYRVELAIRKDWPIPTDSVAQLQASGLLADMRIAISGGQSARMLEPGEELGSAAGGDVFAAMTNLAGELDALVHEQVRPLVQQLGGRLESITSVLDQSLPEVLADARGLLLRLNEAADSVNLLVGPDSREGIELMLKDLGVAAASLRETQARVMDLVGNLDAAVQENRPDIRQTVRDLERTMFSLSQRMDSVVHHMDSSSRNFDEFTRELRRNPSRLLFSPKADPVEEE